MSVNGLNENMEKSFPACLGQMVNLFELNVGVSKNQLCTDKPLHNGSSLSRSRSDVTRMNPIGGQIEEKMIVSDYQNSYSNRKSNGTPMKMLIAQEMSKEMISTRSPNVVAKLMGLETLSVQENHSSMNRIPSKSHPWSHSEIPMSSWEQKNGFFRCFEPIEFKDVRETYQKSPQLGSCDETTDDDRLYLVRQKFAEAKRLSMNEKLRQSKQFHDALEVLNTNKDLFIKCLQEPQNVLSQDFYTLQSIPPPTETRRITVLRPSKLVNNINFGKTVSKDEKQIEKGVFDRLKGFKKSQLGDSPPASSKNYNTSSQPTRIVILKPSPVKSSDIKTVISPESQSPGGINGEEFFGSAADDGNQESREVAKAITQQMREKLVRYHKDEALISSAFSRGYVDEESSSEIECAAGNVSDSEVPSPLSRHSWDYVNNKFGSPYSSSSFSRISYSPESSVCREAKKRLSERWALVASNRSFLDQRPVCRSSSTLGEMLALSETKKTVMPGEVNVKDLPVDLIANETEPRTPEHVCYSPRHLTRSKSVPVFFMDGTRFTNEESASQGGRLESPREESMGKHAKSSFKGKVSLFFSRNKKTMKDKSLSSDSKPEFHPELVLEQSYSHINAGCSDDFEGPEHLSSSNQVGNLGALWPETGFPTEKLNSSGSSCDNIDQPSPVSVLDQPFEEDTGAPSVFSHHAKSEKQGIVFPVNSIRSNLIDKSPPIGSIARSLSWDELCRDSISSYSLNQSTGREIEEREWLQFVKTLLSMADMLGEMQLNSFLAMWHSLDSPLDPSIRDKYIDMEDKESLHEERRRQNRSTRKLIFDCVNTSLIDIAGYGSLFGQRAIPCINSNNNILENSSFSVVDEVWTRINTLFFGGNKCVSENCGDGDTLVMERVVRKEVIGKGWADHLRLVVDSTGKELEENMLEELLQEVVVELTGSLRNQTE